MVIWKYQLPLTPLPIRLELPAGAKLLAVDNQRGQPCLWAMVNPANPREFRRFVIVGTGMDITRDLQTHIGTVVIEPFVWHVFELGNEGE